MLSPRRDDDGAAGKVGNRYADTYSSDDGLDAAGISLAQGSPPCRVGTGSGSSGLVGAPMTGPVVRTRGSSSRGRGHLGLPRLVRAGAGSLGRVDLGSPPASPDLSPFTGPNPGFMTQETEVDSAPPTQPATQHSTQATTQPSQRWTFSQSSQALSGATFIPSPSPTQRRNKRQPFTAMIEDLGWSR